MKKLKDKMEQEEMILAAQTAAAGGDDGPNDDDDGKDTTIALNIGVANFFIAKRAASRLKAFTKNYLDKKAENK